MESMARSFTRFGFASVLVFLIGSGVARAGYYQGSVANFSFVVNSQCNPYTATISNVLIRFNSKTSASISFVENSLGSPFNYSKATSFSGTAADFGPVDNGVFCTTSFGRLRVILSNISFTNTNAISCSLTVRMEEGGFSGGTTVGVTLVFITVSTPLLSISGLGTGKTVCAGSIVNINAFGSSPSGASVYVGGLYKGFLSSDNNFDLGFTGILSHVAPNLDNQSLSVEIRIPSNPSYQQVETIWVGAPLPTNLNITANRQTPLCDASPLTLSINNPATASVAWPDGGPTINNPTNKEYRAVVQRTVNGQAVCPAVTKTINVQVLSFNPAINPPAQTTKCQGDPIDLTVNPNNNIGSFAYAWTRDGQAMGGTSESIAARESGEYKARVTPTGNVAHCPAKESNAVRLNFDAPIADENIQIPKAQAIICGAPDADRLALTAKPDGLGYSWQRDGGGFSANTQTVEVSQAGKYLVNISRGACSRQKSIEVTANNYDPNIAATPAAYCADAAITLRANTNDAAKLDYAWKRDGNAVGTNASTLATATDVGTFKYILETTAKGSGCSAKKSVEISVKSDRAIANPKINLPTGKAKAIICGAPEETAIDLTATADAPTDGINYVWQGTGVTSAGAVGKASQAGDYKVVFERGTCKQEASIKVESGAFTPSISVTSATVFTTPTDVRLCSGETARIASSVAGTGFVNTTANFTYNWFGGPDGTVPIAAQTTNILTTTNAGQYRLQMLLTGSGCKAKEATPQNIRVSIDPAFKNVRISPNPAIICNKINGLEITALTDSSAGATYQWSGGGRAVSGDATKYNVANAGTYAVNLTRGACKATASVTPREEELTVTVAPPNASNPIIVCSGSNGAPIELKATSNLSTATIKWLRDGGTDAPGINTANTYTPTQTGQYYATADFNGICKATSLQKIAVEALNNFAVSITPNNPAPLCDDRPILLTASASEPRFTAQYNYEWTQDSKSIKTGVGTNTFSTGKIVAYDGNTLVLGNESSYLVSIGKDGCKATSSANKITLKPARSIILVLDYNTLEATESIDNKYEWHYKTGRASSLYDSSGYQALTSATARTVLGANVGSYIVRANRNGCGSKFSAAYIVDVTTATNPVLAGEWHVFPNPTTGTITVENKAKNSGSTLIELWSNTGQKLQAYRQYVVRENYSMENLPAGIYYLEIVQGMQKTVKKIIKQ